MKEKLPLPDVPEGARMSRSEWLRQECLVAIGLWILLPFVIVSGASGASAAIGGLAAAYTVMAVVDFDSPLRDNDGAGR